VTLGGAELGSRTGGNGPSTGGVRGGNAGVTLGGAELGVGPAATGPALVACGAEMPVALRSAFGSGATAQELLVSWLP